MLQKDGFFRKRDEKRDDSFFRPATPATATPAPAANVAVEPVTEVKAADARREAKLVVGPEIKIKVEEGAELAGEISMLDKAQSSLAVTRKVA